MTLWYRRERHWRVAIIYSGAALAAAFGGMSDCLLSHVQHSNHSRYLCLRRWEDGSSRRETRVAMVNAVLLPH
jgi:hypothetical protein